ncbi:MAG: hypothetical protein DWH91_01940 [Planctomycetota bacterium]|nr:MAG: hypothetical protein DWH91_01940 [Planctomycetota bacterium]
MSESDLISNESTDRYYRHSGRVPFVGTLSMLCMGGIAAFLLSFLYSLICYFNPIVILQLFIILGYGAALGMAIKLAGRWTKVRNQTFAVLVSLFIGALGIHFAWVWYIFIVLGWDQMVIDFEPTTTFLFIQHLAARGVWQFKGHAPTGWELYLLWGIEAVTILFVCFAIGSQIEHPFCEGCNCWTEPGTPLVVATSDHLALAAQLEAEQYDVIVELSERGVNPNDVLKIVGFRCPHCTDSSYLTVSRVITTPGKSDNDNPNVNETHVIRAIAVPDDIVLQVTELANRPPTDIPELD